MLSLNHNQRQGRGARSNAERQAKVADLPESALARRLSGGGLDLAMGPFAIRLCSPLSALARGLSRLYGDYPLVEDVFIDFRVALNSPGIRRWYRPQVNFSFDGFFPFKPLPQDQAFAMFEWGLNWCIANNAHQYLIVHAAVVEKAGKALILPGTPGSGKSTLCAALVIDGWRLLSDEMALISLARGTVQPIPRPIGLKNASIDIIRHAAPMAVFGEVAKETAKGTVTHMRPPAESVAQAHLSARPAWVVFPRYDAASDLELMRMGQSDAFMKMAENAFNYNVLGVEGFRTLGALVEGCQTFQLRYRNLAQAREGIERLIHG